MTLGSNQQAKDAFAEWLNELSNTSPLPHVARAADMRRNLFKFMLNIYDTHKAVDLPDQAMDTIALALGITIPGPIEAMKIDRMERGEMDSPATLGLSRLDQKRVELKEKATARWKMERDADARGEYFTVVAAYSHAKVFLVIFQGIMDDEWHEAFLSQHTDAFMFLEPTIMVGKFGTIRSEAVRTHTGKHPGDVTIRAILRKGYEQ